MMNTLSRVHAAAAGITLLAGLFAVAVRVAPLVAPTTADAALTQLALVLGQDLGQPARIAQTAAETPDNQKATAMHGQQQGNGLLVVASNESTPRTAEMPRARYLPVDYDVHLATFGTPAAHRKVIRVAE